MSNKKLKAMSKKSKTVAALLCASLLGLGLVTGLLAAGPSLKEPEKARGIAKAMIDREDGKSSYSEIKLVSCAFKMEGGSYKCASAPRIKVFEGVSKDTGANDKDSIALNILIEPADEKGVAFLQKDYEEEGKDSDQWIYLPALKRMKRIVSESENSPKTGTMFGSEFSYEDMEKVHLSDYSYSYEGTETVDGKKCHVITAYPTAKRAPKTSYSKSKSWIDMESLIAIKSESYDRNGRLKKTVYAKQVSKVSGVWVAKQMIIVNHTNSRMSMIAIRKQALNIAVDESLFESRALQDADFLESKMKAIRAKAQ